MPWKDLCQMQVREQFVMAALEPNTNFSELCREYGISRKTGYKWLERYKAEGASGLEDRSRRPKKHPLMVDSEVVLDVVAVRKQHPSWGPKKIHAVLARTLSPETLPSIRTIARILERTGFIARRRVTPTSRPSRPEKPGRDVQAPNDLWTVDFKGWWMTRDKTRCEPLTVRDAFSRKVLAIAVLTSTKADGVVAVFERLFSTYGLPHAIQSDNGSPFVFNRGSLGLTRLSAWWIALGIAHIRSRPGRPSDNGAHERMHRDIADEIEAYAALNPVKQQARCDVWRHAFNHHRPHEALGMKTPASLYRKSSRRYPHAAIDLVYPEDFFTVTVRSKGLIRFRKRDIFLSTALAGYTVGLHFLSPQRFAVWFAHKQLGTIDVSEDRVTLRPPDPSDAHDDVDPPDPAALRHGDPLPQTDAVVDSQASCATVPTPAIPTQVASGGDTREPLSSAPLYLSPCTAVRGVSSDSFHSPFSDPPIDKELSPMT